MMFVFKGLRKRLTSLASKKVANNILHKWIPALVDHLHYVVSMTPSGQLRKEWWLTAVNHICDIHTHSFETFPECRHGQLPTCEIAEDGSRLVPGYLNPGEKRGLSSLVSEQSPSHCVWYLS